ncbi:MAG: putative phosphoserine phosphatase/1-acylglycerol-3-phosphate O-acyltransferase [Halieaceae bacterium]
MLSKDRKQEQKSVAASISHHLKQVKLQSRGERTLALFDFDRTLIAGYSVTAFMWEQIRSGNWSREHLARDILDAIENEECHSSYQRALIPLAHILDGIPEEEMIALGERVFEKYLAAKIFSEAKELIKYHQSLGHQLAIITAATAYQVGPVATALGIEQVYCTGMEVDASGHLTGRIITPTCFGEGKVDAARSLAYQNMASLKDAWFYSDSHDDLPLLQAVGHPVLVNPTHELADNANTQTWPRLDFSSRGGVTVERVVRTALTANSVLTAAAAGAASYAFHRSPLRASNRMTALLGDMGAAFAGIDLDIYGLEHLDRKVPAIFVFNHQSYLDALVLAKLLRKDVVALCKQEVASNPILGPMLKACGTIFVDRDSKSQKTLLSDALNVLAQNKSLVIAPEGTRSTTGELGEFKPGAFFLAKKSGVPIIPIVLHDVAEVLPNGSWLVHPNRVQVSILAPVDFAGMKVREATKTVELMYREKLAKRWTDEAAA